MKDLTKKPTVYYLYKINRSEDVHYTNELSLFIYSTI